MKDRRLTPQQIDRLLANPVKLDLGFPEKEEPEPEEKKPLSFENSGKEYDTLKSDEQIKLFCGFIREVLTRYEENQRLQSEAETMESDLEHCIELAQRLTEKEKKLLYTKLTEVLQTRRACKSENEILQPLYDYFHDKVLLNKMNQLQGVVTATKDAISYRKYACRTSILDDFRN